jgi:3'-phosphoadenosine 5'-phosphosulfate sulfotransferase (PAPS reductase)/FAD synthetase
LNPIYYVDEKTFEEEIKKIPIWQGYSKGFQRTACWTCPFQKVEQWEALKREYPLLWESLREMALTFEFRYYKGDNIVPRFIKYWRGQENG